MTINVVCRRDAINRNRLAPLALVFTHDRRRKFVGLGISEALVHWDFDKQQPTADCPDRAEIQFQITSKIREYEKKIKKLEVLEIPVTFDTLFEQNGKRINCTVGEYFKQIIERLEKVEKYSSASKHKVTLVLVSQFRSVNMRFDELDLTYLREFEIFLSQKGNVNNSCNYAAFQYCRLYLIEILHQTTTHCKCIQFTLCCILSKFYIKPQRRGLRNLRHSSCILSKFYIKPQRRDRGREIEAVVSYRNSTSNHNGSVDVLPGRPVVSYRNSTSNHNGSFASLARFAVVSYRNSTSNHNTACPASTSVYVVSYRNSTSNHNDYYDCSVKRGVVSYRNSTSNHNRNYGYSKVRCVVSYRNSTSNHNEQRHSQQDNRVVSYRNSTSNHNRSCGNVVRGKLYLIEILHQTTTMAHISGIMESCILSKFYIKPQLDASTMKTMLRCILSKFYIKPQLLVMYSCHDTVVSYRNSTSNHNLYRNRTQRVRLYLIEILHQTTTSIEIRQNNA